MIIDGFVFVNLVCAQSGYYMMSSSKDASMKIWDLREGRLLFTLQGHTGPVNAARFSTDGHFFASGGVDQMVMVWKTNMYGVDAPEIEWGQGKRPLTSGIISSPNTQPRDSTVSEPAPIVAPAKSTGRQTVTVTKT
jgi:WD40 repeat protein